MSEANEGHPPSSCWAVFITKAWGEKIEERQQSIPLPKATARTHMDVLRRAMGRCGHRYRMRKLPNATLTGGEAVLSNGAMCNKKG